MENVAKSKAALEGRLKISVLESDGGQTADVDDEIKHLTLLIHGNGNEKRGFYV